MGELHLEIIKDRLLREFKVQANAGKPVVAYREAVTTEGQGEHIFQREIGGHGHFAGVRLAVSPRARGVGSEIIFSKSPKSKFRPFSAILWKKGCATGCSQELLEITP
jgi:translation elongation factor EF-G